MIVEMVPLLLLLAFLQGTPQGSIEVNVQDSLTGQPVAGANITFIFYQTPPPNVVTYMTADENGHVVFSNLAAGRYAVSATRDGYLDSLPISAPGANVTIEPQSPKQTLNLKLTRGAAINGRLVDTTGRPLLPASVLLLRKGYRNGRAVLINAQTRAETDDRGQFRLINIGPGEYFLRAELRPTATAALDKYPRFLYYPGVTDFAQAAPIRVTGPGEIAAGEITAPDVPVFTVSGKVINTLAGGRQLANGQTMRTIASFLIGPRDTTSPQGTILVSNRMYTAGVNDLDQTPFELPGFVAGSYYLYPVADATTLSFATSKVPIDISDKNIEGLNITLAPPPDMKGKIIVEGDPSAIRLETLRVNIRYIEDVPSLVSINSQQPVDPVTGEFTLKSVQEARFLPVIQTLPPDAFIADLRQGSRNAFGDGIQGGGKEAEEPIEIVVNTRGGMVQGTVHDSDSKPVRAGVVLIPDGLRRGASFLYKRSSADASGHFTIRGVAPGAYKIFAWTALPEGSAEENPDFIAPFDGRGTAVTVDVSAPVTVDITVITQ